MRLILLSLFVFATLFANAQNVITGMAPSHIGDKVRLLRYDDYITHKTIEITEGKVLADSTFKLAFNTDETYEAILEIGDSYGIVYIQPDAHYKILFPKVEGGHRLTHNYVSLIFEEAPPKDDINSLILYLDQRIDGFIQVTAAGSVNDSLNPQSVVGDEEWQEQFKGFKDHLIEVYDSVKNTYFLEYLVFSIANLELLGSSKDASIGMNKESVYHAYIHKAPFLPRNDAYMKLINNFYSNIFPGLADTSRQILKSIILEDVDSLQHFMSQHLHYSRKDLGELLMIKALGEAYMSSTYPRRSILNMLETLKTEAKYEANQNLAGNVLGYLTNMRKGFPAPDFELTDQYGATSTLSTFKGKFIYITFFETWCVKCQSDFEIMVKLKERYGENIEFVSICMDKEKSAMEKFLKKNGQYDWTFLWGGDNPELMDRYDISNYPIYFMLDQEGNILYAPALTPSPKGNYESIDRTMYQLNRSVQQYNQNRPPGPPQRPR